MSRDPANDPGRPMQVEREYERGSALQYVQLGTFASVEFWVDASIRPESTRSANRSIR